MNVEIKSVKLKLCKLKEMLSMLLIMLILYTSYERLVLI